MKILHWNCNSILKKLDQLHLLADDADIIIISETNLNEKKFLKKNLIPGYKYFRKDRLSANKTKGGGIIVFVKINIRCSVVIDTQWIFNNLETLVLEIFIDNNNLKIVAAYRPPDEYLSQSDWNQLFCVMDCEEPCILAADLNAHNTNWNCIDCNLQGYCLEEAMSAYNYSILNVDTVTRYNKTHKSWSNIDLFIVPTNMLDFAHSFAIEEQYGSDHRPILANFNFTLDKFIFKKMDNRIETLKTEWLNYEALLWEKYDNYQMEIDNNNCARIYEELTDDFINFTEICTPSKNIQRKNNNVNDRVANKTTKQVDNKCTAKPWWNAECQLLVDKRKQAYKNFLLHGDVKYFIEYKKANATITKQFKCIKRNYFRSFAENLNFRQNPSKVWEKCRALNGYVKISNNDVNNKSINRQELCLKAFDKITPSNILIDNNLDNFFFNQVEELDGKISNNEYFMALNQVRNKTKSAPGLDKISYNMIIYAPTCVHEIIIKIFNKFLEASVFPISWKTNEVFFIDKNGGEAVRPITLTSCMAKFFERIVNYRLKLWIEKNNIIPMSQAGFRSGRGCIDSLTKLSADVRCGFLDGQATHAASLDVKGAFDNVNPSILSKILIDIGCSDKIIKFMRFMCFDRSLTFKRGLETELKRFVSLGLAQGSVLSPIYYSVYVHKAVSDIHKEVNILQYADDMFLYIHDYNYSSSNKILENAIVTIKKNLKKNRS